MYYHSVGNLDFGYASIKQLLANILKYALVHCAQQCWDIVMKWDTFATAVVTWGYVHCTGDVSIRHACPV